MSEKFEEEKSLGHRSLPSQWVSDEDLFKKKWKKNKLTIGWYWIRSSDWQIKEEGQMRWFEKPWIRFALNFFYRIIWEFFPTWEEGSPIPQAFFNPVKNLRAY